jgi:cytochrome c-type biogenesis protein CcmF
MADVGFWAMLLTCIVSAYAVAALVLGVQRHSPALQQSARNGVLLVTAASTVSILALIYLLVRRDFSISYVAEHVDSGLPLVYTVSALWAGQEGSLLLWLWLLTCFGAVLMSRRLTLSQPLTSYALAVVGMAQFFLALVLLLVSNPFARMGIIPAEGQGLSPLLQNLWMIVHPPVVFAGYAAYTIPFALALAGLAAGHLDRAWLQTVRRWALLAWILLGAGILMGARWAYQELGWGGYWGWDPVENSSLLPWLTGAALLHALMMQERRAALTTWNLWLVVLTFGLCNFATFVTRSGIVQSVHAFGQSSLGYYFMAFIVLCFAAFIILLTRRRGQWASGAELGSLFSREVGLFLTILLFLGTALVVLLGTLFPSLSEVLLGRSGTLDISFYERSVGPLAQIIILIMGICPWLAWGSVSTDRLRRNLLPPALLALFVTAILFLLGIRQTLALIAFAICTFVLSSLLLLYGREVLARRRATGEAWPQVLAGLAVRKRRRYGGHLVHLGIVLVALGIAGSSLYKSEVQVALAPGESATVQNYTVTYRDLVQDRAPSSHKVAAQLDVTPDAGRPTTLWPRQELFFSTQQWVTEVAIRSTLQEDLYVILAGVEDSGLASFRMLVNPLVVWLWIGGGVLLLGGSIAWWPARREMEAA